MGIKIESKNIIQNYLFALIIRIFIALYMIPSMHKADEVYQGPEVSHYMVYG